MNKINREFQAILKSILNPFKKYLKNLFNLRWIVLIKLKNSFGLVDPLKEWNQCVWTKVGLMVSNEQSEEKKSINQSKIAAKNKKWYHRKIWEMKCIKFQRWKNSHVEFLYLIFYLAKINQKWNTKQASNSQDLQKISNLVIWIFHTFQFLVLNLL